jgi:hypothetical protein
MLDQALGGLADCRRIVFKICRQCFLGKRRWRGGMRQLSPLDLAGSLQYSLMAVGQRVDSARPRLALVMLFKGPVNACFQESISAQSRVVSRIAVPRFFQKCSSISVK